VTKVAPETRSADTNSLFSFYSVTESLLGCAWVFRVDRFNKWIVLTNALNPLSRSD
jgi:hypothetical protein